MNRQLVFISSLILVVSAQLVLGQVRDGVVLVDTEDPTTGVTGRDYVLQCEQNLRSDASLDLSLSWSHEGVSIVADDVKYDIVFAKNETAMYSKSALTIKDATLDDVGNYRCEGVAGGTKVQLLLSLDAEVYIVGNNEDFGLAEGLILTCNVGKEASNKTVEWSYKKNVEAEDSTYSILHDGMQDVNGDNSKEVEIKGNKVTFLTADRKAAGLYRCTVNLGSTTKSDVAVVSGLLEVFAPQSIKVSEKEKGVIRCESSSSPRPVIIWSVNDTELEGTTAKYEIKAIPPPDENTVISELHIKNVVVDDGEPTNYTCSGNNGAEQVDREIIVRIRDPLAALWPFIGIVSEVAILIIIILIHEACTKGEDIGETDDDEEDHLLQKNRTITRDGEQTRMRGTNN